MFDDMAAAVAAARSRAQLDELSRGLWAAHACGRLGDDQAQRLAELIAAQRGSPPSPLRRIIAAPATALRPSMFPRRQSCRSPDRLASRERRRRVASAGAMPPALAASFTEGQRAALAIVAAEVAACGVCNLAVDAIAARAGISRRLVQTALRLAEGDGLLRIEERRRHGRKNETNVVHIIAVAWLAWIARGGRRLPGVIGCKSLHATNSKIFTRQDQRLAEAISLAKQAELPKPASLACDVERGRFLLVAPWSGNATFDRNR